MKKEMSIEEIRNSQIEILDFFDEICKNNNLKYSIYAGTLIGAVRHKGYIPWDDDIDVIMPRNDYDILVKNAERLSNERFKIQTPYNYKKEYYPYTYVKIYDLNTDLIEKPETKAIKCHIYIDVFCQDGIPSKEKEYLKLYKKISFYKKVHSFLSFSYYNKNYGNIVRRIFWYIAYIISKIISPKKIMRIIENKLRKNNYHESKLVANFASGYGLKEIIDRKVFYDFKKSTFEGKEYYITNGYDKMLTGIYGDYMKFPPKEQQIKTHDNIAYHKENLDVL